MQNKRVENNNAQDIEGTTVVASKSNNEQVNVPVTQIDNYNSNCKTVTETQPVVNSNNLISENIEKARELIRWQNTD